MMSIRSQSAYGNGHSARRVSVSQAPMAGRGSGTWGVPDAAREMQVVDYVCYSVVDRLGMLCSVHLRGDHFVFVAFCCILGRFKLLKCFAARNLFALHP